MPTQDNINQIAALLTQSIKEQLLIPRQSRGYNGEPKRGTSAPISSGALLESVNVEVIGSLEQGDLAFLVKMEDYWYWVNFGRKPGRMPPIAPIDRWVITKQGLKDSVRDKSGRFIKRKSLVYLIRRSIGMYGYAGTNFVEKGFENTVEPIRANLGDAVAEWFATIIRGE